MKWNTIKQFCVQENSEADFDSDGYIGYLPKPGLLMQCQATRDNQWYTISYIQICHDPETGDDDFVIQLEGLPEDPFNTTAEQDWDDTDISIKMFAQFH